MQCRAVVVVATFLVAACSSGSDEAQQRTTVPTAPALTTTTNPYAVPDVIDVAYVNRVLAGLDAAVGEVVRMVVQNRALTPEALERLRALYRGTALEEQINGMTTDSASGFSQYRVPPGNARTEVARLITVTPSCIFTEVRRDYSAVGLNPDPTLSRQYVGIEPLSPSGPERTANATGWIMIYDGYQRNRSRPPNPCTS